MNIYEWANFFLLVTLGCKKDEISLSEYHWLSIFIAQNSIEMMAGREL